MTASTSPDGIIYPNDPNAPADVVNDMRIQSDSIQTALNNHMDAAPTAAALTMSSGWKANGTIYGAATVQKTGRLVVSRGRIERTANLTVTDNVYFQIATIPAGYRPAMSIHTAATWQGTTTGGTHNQSAGMLIANIDGTVQFAANFSGVIEAGEWISLGNLVWFTP